MTADGRRDRHVDVLEFISCGGSTGSEARAALEMFLLQTRSILTPGPNAGERLDGRRGRGDNKADARPYPRVCVLGYRRQQLTASSRTSLHLRQIKYGRGGRFKLVT